MSRHRIFGFLALSLIPVALIEGGGSLAQRTPSAPANTVSGRVLDERGAPVPGARIIVEPVMFRGTFVSKTDSRGAYQSIELNAAANPYTVTAYKEVTYHGRRYCIRMAGEGHEYKEAFNAKSGAVRNFRWKVRGSSDMPEDGSSHGDQYWGGSLKFENISGDDAIFVDWNATIEVRLIPDGPLIDGSQGKTVTRTVKVKDGLGDIPVGAYKLSASLVTPSGTKTPLKVSAEYDEDRLAATTLVLFNGFDSCGHSGTFRTTPIWLAR